MIEELIDSKRKQLSEVGYIQFSENELDSLNLQNVQKIQETFHGFGFMRLPQKEILFFEWLKEKDREVWDDLWESDDEPYLVSLDFLKFFTGDGNGFPICDLENVDNYWFSFKHIKPKGREKFSEINTKLENNEKLNLEQTLLMEVTRNAIDIWHFAYFYELSVKQVKEKISEMNSNDIMVHLPDRDDLTKYIDF